MLDVEEIAKTRNYDRFKELAEGLMVGSQVDGAEGVVRLLRLLPPTGDRKWWLIVRCGENRIREAIPEILGSFAPSEKNPRSIREVSLLALDKLLDPDARIAFLIDAMGDKDPVIAESAAIRVGASEDQLVVAPLLRWLEERMRQPRSKAQARRTAEALAACVRLGNDEQRARLGEIVAGAKLAELERRSLDGRYVGQVFQPGYPIISWPV